MTKSKSKGSSLLQRRWYSRSDDIYHIPAFCFFFACVNAFREPMKKSLVKNEGSSSLTPERPWPRGLTPASRWGPSWSSGSRSTSTGCGDPPWRQTAPAASQRSELVHHFITEYWDKLSDYTCGGFFLACEDFGRMFDHSFPACAFFFGVEVEISSRTLIPLFTSGSVHSGSASWDDHGRMFQDKLRVSSFPDRFPHHA